MCHRYDPNVVRCTKGIEFFIGDVLHFHDVSITAHVVSRCSSSNRSADCAECNRFAAFLFVMADRARSEPIETCAGAPGAP